MESTLKFWNLVHYKIYVWQTSFHLLFNYLNPFVWLVKLPIVKKYFKKHGIVDFKKHMDNRIFNNKKSGINITISGIHMGGQLIILEFTILNLIQYISNKRIFSDMLSSSSYTIVFIVLITAIPGIINYFTLFKRKMYLIYFREFENNKVKYSLRYNLLASGFILVNIGLLIVSFVLLRRNF